MQNSSLHGNFSELPPIDSAELARGIVLAVLCAVSAAGNTSALVFLLRKRRYHDSVFSQSLLNLCLADLVTTSFRMGGVAVWTLTVVWLAGEPMCKMFKFFQVFGSNVSTHLITFISVDRALSICYPMDAISSARRRVKYLHAAAWSASALCSIPQLLLFKLEPVILQGLPTGYYECASSAEPSIDFAYSMFVCTTSFLLPVLIMTVSYTAIFVAIRKRSTEKLTPASVRLKVTKKSTSVAANDRNSESNSSCYEQSTECPKKPKAKKAERKVSSPTLSTPDNRKVLFQRARRRSSLTLFVVVITFLICWSPYYMMYLIFSITRYVNWIYELPVSQDGAWINEVAYWLNMLTHLNTLINPLIYRSVPVDSIKRKKYITSTSNNTYTNSTRTTPRSQR